LKKLPLAVQQKQILVTCNYEARRRVRLPWSATHAAVIGRGAAPTLTLPGLAQAAADSPSKEGVP